MDGSELPPAHSGDDSPGAVDLPVRMLQGRLRVLLVGADGTWAAHVKRTLRALRSAQVDVEHVPGPGHVRGALAGARFDAAIVALGSGDQQAGARGHGVLVDLALAGPDLALVLVLDHPPQEADSGQLLAYAHAFLLKADITPGALAGALEIALRQHQLQARFRAVLDASPDGMLVLDGDGVVRYANAAAGLLLAPGGALAGVSRLPAGGSHELVHAGRVLDVRRSPLDARHGSGAVLVTLRDVTALKAHEAELRFAAEHDPLTGLANAARLHRELRGALARSRRDGTRLAVLYLDMDGFKAVNDVYGHATGDALLREIGARLGASGREGEVIGRLGGDEFAMVAENVPHGAEAHIAERLLKVAAQPLHAAGRPLSISMSIGVAVAPDDGREVEVLLRAADSAMYAAKRAGRSTYRRAGDAQRAARARSALADALRGALLRREFEVFYQPLFDLETGRVEGAEALVRWHRQPDVIESPAAFLDVAEETGLIVQLGDLVSEALCQQWVRWRWATGRELRVAINLSARELRTPGIFARLRSTLAVHGVPGRCLSIEVREDVLVSEVERLATQAGALDGVLLSVGDLSGESLSWRRLTALPVGALKLSRWLVEGLTQDGPQAAIASGLIALADGLGVDVVAEGVETAQQAARLRTLGCHLAQGFYFSAPLAGPAFLECLSHTPRRPVPQY